MRNRKKNPVRAALAAGGLALALVVPGSAMSASASVVGEEPVIVSPGEGARPVVPAEYAQAVFDAWAAGDNVDMVDKTVTEALQVLAARDAKGEKWAPEALCEGAAGNTHCTWTSPDVQLTLRVDNEAASEGAARAVTEAVFAPTPGNAVALWPVVSAEQAWNTQASVDAGHSPWMLNSATVVEFYASAELGFEQPVVESLAPTFFTYRVVDAATGVAADVQVHQPAKLDATGIWAVSRTTSVPAEVPVIPV